MRALKQMMRLTVILAVCALVVACPEPTSDAGGMVDAFEVSLGFPRGLGGTSRSTINDDGAVVKVYAKVFDSAREHLPSTDASGITELEDKGSYWSATVHLAAPASGEITFVVWAENVSGQHLYSGDVTKTIPGSTSITLPTAAGYSLGDMGPAGGYIFYDDSVGYDLDGDGDIEAHEKDLLDGTNDGIISGDQFLESAKDNIMIGDDYLHYFGLYRDTLDGSNLQVVDSPDPDIGAGESNTDEMVNAMGTQAIWYDTSVAEHKYTDVYAAKLCLDATVGGCDDWFLPSRYELKLIDEVLEGSGVGNFDDLLTYTWSSTEYSASQAWNRNFTVDGGGDPEGQGNKYDQFLVRPVRAF